MSEKIQENIFIEMAQGCTAVGRYEETDEDRERLESLLVAIDAADFSKFAKLAEFAESNFVPALLTNAAVDKLVKSHYQPTKALLERIMIKCYDRSNKSVFEAKDKGHWAFGWLVSDQYKPIQDNLLEFALKDNDPFYRIMAEQVSLRRNTE